LKKVYLFVIFVFLVTTLWSQSSLTKSVNLFRPAKGIIISDKLNSFNFPILKSKQLQKTILSVTKERLDSMVFVNSNDLNNLTTPNFKTINTFDIGGNLIENSLYDWSEGSSAYNFAYKNDFTYDNQGRIQTNIEYDSISGSYFVTKYEYAYNTNGNISTLDYIENSWKSVCKTEYVYTGSNIQTEIEYDWDSYANIWNLEAKTFHYFDSYKNDTLQKTYNKDYVGNWNLSNKLINHYTSNETGSKTAKIYYDISYNSDSTTISYAQKKEYTYDNYGNMLTMIVSDYNSNTQAYTIQGKYEFGYDISKNLSEVSMGNLAGIECNNKLTNYKYYTYTDSKYVLAGTINFYYSNMTISTDNVQIANNSVCISPNPVTEFVKFNISGSEGQLSVVIIDLQGKTLLEKQVENNAPVDLNGLKKGIYLYKITDNSRTYNGKVILK
jgi:hypothetical protein